MQEEWWERPSCLLCDYWWALLLLLASGLAGYFSRDYWRPYVGLGSQPAMAEATPVLGTGDIQVTLTWNNTNDLDLWVTDPSGVTIVYHSPSSPTGGQLDVDANAGCSQVTVRPVENIFWPSGGAPPGDYMVEVQYYQQCAEAAPISYHVRLLVDGQVSEYDGQVQAQGDRQTVANFRR